MKVSLIVITGNEKQCPACECSWVGPPIPEKDQHLFGGKTHFSNKIAIYDRDLDATIGYKCPECNAFFKRKLWRDIEVTESSQDAATAS